MNVQDVPRGDIPHSEPPGGNDYASAALISAATAVLAQRKRDLPEDFLVKLFGLAVPQDLERYSAEDLADIAERAWALLQERQASAAKIRPVSGSIHATADSSSARVCGSSSTVNRSRRRRMMSRLLLVLCDSTKDTASRSRGSSSSSSGSSRPISAATAARTAPTWRVR